MTRESMADTAEVAQDDAAFSRSSGLFSQSGDADDEVKTRLSFEDGAKLRRLARENGMSVSMFVKVLILRRLYGAEGLTRIASQHLAAVAGDVPESGQDDHPPSPQGGRDPAAVLPAGRR